MSQLPLRPNVCLFVLNLAGLIFLGRRHGQPQVWQLPQGGVEEQGTLEENALREAHEELGVSLSSLKVIQRLNSTHAYDWAVPPEYAVGKFRGQQQTFFVLEFIGADSEIELNRFSPEFDEFCWCKPEDVRARAEAKRLPGYEAPLREVEQLLKARGF